MQLTQVIFEHEFDLATTHQLARLRTARLKIARAQLSDLQGTARNLNSSDKYNNLGNPEFVAKLRRVLEEKIKILESRNAKKSIFYRDEVEMYLSLAKESLPI